MGSFVSSFVLAVELCGPSTKTPVGIAIEAPFALGEAAVSLLGIAVKEWRDFQVESFFLKKMWFKTSFVKFVAFNK